MTNMESALVIPYLQMNGCSSITTHIGKESELLLRVSLGLTKTTMNTTTESALPLRAEDFDEHWKKVGTTYDAFLTKESYLDVSPEDYFDTDEEMDF